LLLLWLKNRKKVWCEMGFFSFFFVRCFLVFFCCLCWLRVVGVVGVCWCGGVLGWFVVKKTFFGSFFLFFFTSLSIFLFFGLCFFFFFFF